MAAKRASRSDQNELAGVVHCVLRLDVEPDFLEAADGRGMLEEMLTPYPGGNLFSLASGGAIYVRDPHSTLSDSQLNGGEFTELSEADWAVIEPLLMRNEEHFGIPLQRLLTVDGQVCNPAEVYRKIIPVKSKALHAEAAWSGHAD